jgi:hypothetical protein
VSRTSGPHCLFKLSLLQRVDRVDITVRINLLEVVIEACLAVSVLVALVAASNLLEEGPELAVSIAHGRRGDERIIPKLAKARDLLSPYL